MSCSPIEIERKRQEARQKLARKSSNSPGKASSLILKKRPAQFYMDQTDVESPSKIINLGHNIFNSKVQSTLNSPAVRKSSNGTLVASTSKVTCSISVISSERLLVKTSVYSQPVIEVLKSIPSKHFDPKTRNWNIHIKDYDILVTKLNALKTEGVTLETLPKFVLKCLKNVSMNNEVDISQIDPNLFETLLPFQLEGLQFGIQREGRCLIADDMGLGKTFQALGIMVYYKNDWPLLIVTTASMKNVWEETIFKHIPSVSIMEVQYMVSSKDFIGNSSVLIVSYDLMSRCVDKLLQRGFGCIIIDESHNLKNYKTKVTQAAIKLCKMVKRVVLLSGTPAMSRPKELYSQLCLIDERFFGSFFEFAKRYCDMQQTVFGLNSSGQSNLQELEFVLKKKFMIRRKKEDVLGSLPDKTQEIIKLDVKLKDLKKEEKERLDVLSSQYEETKKAADKQTILLHFFCETAKIKLAAVCSHVEKVLMSKQKILVFAHHLAMLDGIEKVLKYHEYKYVRIDGNTSTEQRKYFIDKFQTDDNYLCALLSITSTNAGITLTAAQNVIFAELHWNPSILSQAEARVHRIGQNKPVLIQYLLADGTADNHIWKLLKEKENILKGMGLMKETFASIQQKSTTPLERDQTFSSSNSSGLDEDCLLDDGFDDLLCNIEF